MIFTQIIIMLTAIVLLPLLPAVIIFKCFSDSKANVKGLLYLILPKIITANMFGDHDDGIDVKFEGAFAGYFIIFIVIIPVCFMFYNNYPRYELWAAEGVVQLEEEEFCKNDFMMSVAPPDQKVYSNGRFFVKDVLLAINKGERQPSLVLMKKGYKDTSVILEEKPPEIADIEAHQITFNKKEKKIIIQNPIILKKEKTFGEYSWINASAAEPLDIKGDKNDI